MGNLEKLPIHNPRVDGQLSDKSYITPPPTFMCCTMYSLAKVTSLQSKKKPPNYKPYLDFIFKNLLPETVFFDRVSFFGIPDFLFIFLTEIYMLYKY